MASISTPKSAEKATGESSKAGRIGHEDQFAFLISCIRYSVNGKVDFEKVAKECNVVSKGAAAKRYERMMKAHGISQSQLTPRDTSVKSTPRAKSTKPRTPAKKRKANDSDSSDEKDSASSPIEDDPDFSTPSKKVKTTKSEKDMSTNWTPVNKVKLEDGETNASLKEE